MMPWELTAWVSLLKEHIDEEKRKAEAARQ
jgi:hypothetical protein